MLMTFLWLSVTPKYENHAYSHPLGQNLPPFTEQVLLSSTIIGWIVSPINSYVEALTSMLV